MDWSVFQREKIQFLGVLLLFVNSLADYNVRIEDVTNSIHRTTWIEKECNAIFYKLKFDHIRTRCGSSKPQLSFA